MLVIEQSKALALKLNNPGRVLASVPSAKVCDIRGTPLVIVPHNLDEVKVLNNLGIKSPSPILHYYSWPGRFTPFEHQRQTAAFLTLHHRCFVLNQIGTGKSMSALWAADYLMRTKKVKKVLILSPLSTLERVWGDAIFSNLIDRKFVVMHGTADRRKKLLKQDVDYYIINHDGFSIIANECIGMFDLVIVDEAAVLRNPSTNRFKFFRKWLEKNPQVRLWMMTGTPTPNGPTDAWALAKLVGNPNIPNTFAAFRDQVMVKVAQWKFIPRPNAIELVRHVLQPAVMYKRDLLDLPETIFSTRSAPLSPSQKLHFQQMLKTFTTELAQGQITAANEAVKLGKLIQIVCGVAYGNDGSPIELDCAPRISLVQELIEEAGEKVILFVPLTGTLHMLARELSKHWSVAVVNGDVSKGERDRIFHAFQHSPEPRVLIAHPGTMAHGLTLTSATTTIWYGPINSNEVYTQANGRTDRIGKRSSSNVIHIESTDIERKMYDRLQNKQRLQGLLLDLIKDQMR